MNSDQTKIILHQYLLEAKLRNHKFSLRGLAKKLELSPSELSEFLNGKRKLSKPKLEKLVKRMELFLIV